MDRTTTPGKGLRVGLLAALLCSAAAAAADTANVYRWVDKDGRVHYGDQPGANAQRLNPKTLTSTDDDSGAGGAVDAAAAKQAAVCKQKSEQLNTYQKAASVTETDALGNQHEYTPEEKDQLVAKTQKYLDEHCASTANAR